MSTWRRASEKDNPGPTRVMPALADNRCAHTQSGQQDRRGHLRQDGVADSGPVEVVEQQDELVAPEASREPTQARRDGGQPVGVHGEQHITGGVTEPVVDRLEPIEVDQDEHACPPHACGE